MSLLGNFFTDDLAIDIGTVNTLIFAPERGVVLNEPSAVAIHKYTGEVLAVGTEAYKMLGREPYDTEVYRPVRGGSIDNFDAAEKMLATFIARVQGNHHVKRSHMVIGVPGSSTPIEQRSVREAARSVKATRVDLVDGGLAAALGAGLSWDDERAHLVVDIGGGTTNVAIVASGAIISSNSLPVAGNAMDAAIQDYVRNKYEMQIGERTAEQVKKELGAAGSEDGKTEARRMEVVGKQLTDGLAKSVELGSDEVRQALEPVLAEIVSGARRAIEDAKPDVTADIYQTGLILTGGGALLEGMAERLKNELRLHVAVAEDPLAAVALGAGRLLAAPERLHRAAIREDAPVWQASDELVVNW